MIKKFLLVLLTLLIIIPFLWSIYAYLYLRISESDARDIATKIVHEKYSTICGGNFEKNLILTINHPDAKFSFSSNNGKCSIFIDVGEY